MSISPGAYSPAPSPQPQSSPLASVPVAPAPSGGKAVPILIGVVIALAVATGYLFYQVNQVKSDFVKRNEALAAEVEKLQETSSISAQSQRRKEQELKDQLETARRQAKMAVGEAKTEALKKVEETKQELEAAQAAAQKQVESHIDAVKADVDTTNTKVAAVNTDVTNVKSDLGNTKSQLEKTIADLKRVNGDVDGHGVLIATNQKELSALRALGERNYVEFDIRKSKQSQKVGDIQLRLEKADPKHNRYTIELTADDKTTQKKDRTVNEPLQFMTSKAKQPYEIVVNDVKKDQITGYLSIPKVLNARQ